MRKNYKKKRVRKDKNDNASVNEKNNLKNIVYTTIGVLVFVGVFYGINMGLNALGVFDAGYTPPALETIEIGYDEILIGNVFNKPDKSYYVVFDTFGDKTNNIYIDYLISAKEYEDKIYKVDMSNPNNKSYVSDEANEKATKVSELKINDVTLIKIVNGKILSYVTGDNGIEEYLEKLSK